MARARRVVLDAEGNTVRLEHEGRVYLGTIGADGAQENRPLAEVAEEVGLPGGGRAFVLRAAAPAATSAVAEEVRGLLAELRDRRGGEVQTRAVEQAVAEAVAGATRPLVLSVAQARGLVGQGEDPGGPGSVMQEGLGIGCVGGMVAVTFCVMTLATFEVWPLACALGVVGLQLAWCAVRAVQLSRRQLQFWAPVRGEEGDLQLQETGGRLWVRAEKNGAEAWRPVEDFAAVDVGAAGAPAAGGEA